jgi:AcrR family transcriptional regulator
MPRRSREQASQDTREALLRAGLRLFVAQGPDKPSLDAICEAAGFTRGAFYVHFHDRDDFLVAILDRVLADYTALIVESADDGGDWASSIARFVAALGPGGDSPFLTERGQLRLLIEGCERSPEIRARFQAVSTGSTARLARRLEAAQRAGALRADVPPDAVAALLVQLVLGQLVVSQTGLPDAIGPIAGLVLGALRP